MALATYFSGDYSLYFVCAISWIGFVIGFSTILWQDFCQVAYGFIRRRPKVIHWRSNLLYLEPWTSLWKKVTAILRPRVGTSPFLEGLGSRWGSTIQYPIHVLLTVLYLLKNYVHVITKCSNIWKWSAGSTLARWSALLACGMCGKPIWWVTLYSPGFSLLYYSTIVPNTF